MVFRHKVCKPWSWLTSLLSLWLAILDGGSACGAPPRSFTVARAGSAFDQPLSKKTIAQLEAQKTYPLLKTGGPGGNWCKLQLPQGAGWILCAAGSIDGAAAVPQERAGGRVQVPPQELATAPGAAGAFDYYLLSLSWTPAFCATHPDRVEQCGVDSHFGFIIHGLWPQHDRGGYPEDCASADSPDDAVVQQMLPLMPDRKLISHEWSKHGTCSGLKPKDYFAQATAAYRSLRIPESLRQPKLAVSSTLAEIEQSFIDANPGLTGEMMVVICKERVSEIRFCFDKSLHLRRCGVGIKDSCNGRATFLPTR